MTSYQIIYDDAIGNYGLFPTYRARELGISGGTLVKLAQRGRLERLAHGLYRIDKFVPRSDGLDAYACAVACCGKDAYLWGPSVLEIYELCPTDPSLKYVATPHRFRGKVSEGIVVKKLMKSEETEIYEGIRIQGARQAILSSQHIIMLDRLLEAVDAAEERGLLDSTQKTATIRELYKND